MLVRVLVSRSAFDLTVAWHAFGMYVDFVEFASVWVHLRLMGLHVAFRFALIVCVKGLCLLACLLAFVCLLVGRQNENETCVTAMAQESLGGLHDSLIVSQRNATRAIFDLVHLCIYAFVHLSICAFVHLSIVHLCAPAVTCLES